ncbi:MAG: hypothetical protein EBS05_07680 [Proteobacteria bacterium]|nr:hypothetical protein [Pseudomonadota bacterium]
MSREGEGDIGLVAASIGNGREIIEQALLPFLGVKELEAILEKAVQALSTDFGKLGSPLINTQRQSNGEGFGSIHWMQSMPLVYDVNHRA